MPEPMRNEQLATLATSLRLLASEASRMMEPIMHYLTEHNVHGVSS